MAWGITDRRHFMKHVATSAAVAGPVSHFVSNIHAATPTLKKNNKAIIVLWMGGGPTTIDLWDMKPGHANGGEHKPISTSAAGVKISEHLPNVAKQMKNLAIIRSLTTSEGDHDRGTTLMNTGRAPNPLVQFPSLGSVMAYQHRENETDLPGFVSVGGGGGRGPGFLGMRYAPFTVQNPGTPPENLLPPRDVKDRMDRRAGLFDKLEGSFRTGVERDAVKAHADVYAKAMNLVVSERKEVFSLDKESAALKEEYGTSAFGKGCLLARKLVEAGSVCVEVSLGGWDMHNGIFNALATRALPALDKGMGALVRDLADRGLSKNVEVIWMGEFGRTPRINQNGGRDHYPRAWSIVVGGGTIKGGQAYGSTDEGGEAVKEKPTKIGDVFATLYKGLGMDPAAQIRDNLGRPTAIAGDKVEAIKDLVG